MKTPPADLPQRETDTFLELALDASGAGTWWWDVVTDRSWWDARYHEIYGFAPHESPGYETWLARVHPDDRAPLRARVETLLAPGAGDGWSEEFRAFHPVKGERWMAGLGRVERDDAGRVLRFCGINLDVTERKRAEQAVRESLRRAEEVAHVGYWIWNLATNEIAWSDEVYRILRVSRDELEPRIDALVRLIHPEDLGRISRFVEPLVGGELPGNSFEYRVILADGTVRHLVSDVASRVTDTSGNVVQLSGVLHDVTARRRAEAEVLRIGENERQRVAAELHDGVLQELAGTSYLATAVQRELEREQHPLAAKLARITRAIESMIDHTREVALAMDPTVPGGSGLVGALRSLTESMASTHGVACPFECSESLSFDDPGAANHLYRIAQEAIRNAIRHGRAACVTLRLGEENGHVILSVGDDGSGLPPAVASGPGMGLHVMRYRATAIGGTLAVQPRRGGGTEVICRFRRGA